MSAIAAVQAPWRASLALEFERRGPRTLLAFRRHEGPLVVQKPLYPEGDAACHAIVVHPPAGVAGGDQLELRVRAAAEAAVVLTTPGAARWYRSSGPSASQRVELSLDAGARLEWLPQENIVFDGAIADLHWKATLRGSARLIAWDVFCLGRSEGFHRGRCRLETRVEVDEALRFIERGRIDARGLCTSSHAGLGGSPVFGTMLVGAPGIEDDWLSAVRELRVEEGDGAVTRLPGLLVARYRGQSSEAARAYFIAIWKLLREPVIGLPPMEPRIWRT